ncbi:L-lactate dehydrogenase (cytochrome) [Geosmithia morbida]|uniref:L-lactate dehydrogenase (cytochrome) n=1 Tax=Geosmithia morbida TaxID=1094350 RepID=A0A9P4YNF3_9HYPO|nr:L-lactate dehydrogenase (cytochrome) [Geosmithia morbida]KAF4120158.1 L-lactate dehydrogenase (cytochrome) [Geosmithia morbida]
MAPDTSTLPPLAPRYQKAITLIDNVHATDPNMTDGPDGPKTVPYELHYAREMTRWLEKRKPDASPVLQVACRAQHFRRWGIPRSSFPMTRPGYLTWRAKLKTQAAKQVAELLCGIDDITQEDRDRVAALIRKEKLESDEEVQVLEDVACLVFLDDQFDDFESKAAVDEAKMMLSSWKFVSKPKSPCSATPTMASGTKPPLSTLISTHDFEQAASHTLAPKTWAFISSAATDLHTKARNRRDYASIGLRPRALRDVSTVDLSTTMLGHVVRVPIFCSPVAMAGLVHEEGEKDIARACGDSGVAQCVSTSASFPIEDVRSAVGSMPLFFQLYVDRDRERSRRLLRRARDAGASAIFLTVDAPVPGKREADERIRAGNGLSSGMSGATAGNDAKGGALGRTMGAWIDASVSWADLAWLRSCAPGLRIVLKGVQTCEDAVMAAQAGVDAIVVSNHGGRSLDTAASSIMALLEMRVNCPHVFDAMDVLVDGGVTRGTDIFKALCLGAKAVGIGRGSLYALNYGREGVAKYIEILRDELETTMKMCGATSIQQLHPGYLNTLEAEQRVPHLDRRLLQDVSKAHL